MKKIMRIVFVLLLFVMITITGSKTIKAATGYIYTGDSRIRRLNLTIKMSKMDKTWVYCKSGKGYNWFVGDSIKGINSTMKKHPEIDNWVIVSGWGVNDLWNINAYLSKYKQLLYNDWKNCKLYLMSVNPVNGGLQARYSRIGSFNNQIKSFINANQKKAENRLYYVDTNAYMNKNGFSTIDGLHYSEKTNKDIYEVIRTKIDETNAELSCEETTFSVNAIRSIMLQNVRHKVKWEIEDDSVVKIIKKGGKYKQYITLRALAPGSTSVTATCLGMTFTCEITVDDNYPLTVYFSYDGMVERAAEEIQRKVGGEIVCIYSNPIYPVTEQNLEIIKNIELQNNARPEMLLNVRKNVSAGTHKTIKPGRFSIDKYTSVNIGYPVWKGYAPRVLCTFLDTYQMSGKKIRMFAVSDDIELDDGLQSVNELVTYYKLDMACEAYVFDEETGLTKRIKEELLQSY